MSTSPACIGRQADIQNEYCPDFLKGGPGQQAVLQEQNHYPLSQEMFRNKDKKLFLTSTSEHSWSQGMVIHLLLHLFPPSGVSDNQATLGFPTLRTPRSDPLPTECKSVFFHAASETLTHFINQIC